MKDLPPRPQPPQPYVALPRELRLVQVGDGELRAAADGDRRHVERARSARRRLFVDDDAADEMSAAIASNIMWERGRRRARWPEDPLALYTQDAVDKAAAEQAAAAARRWNFDFENERPLEGQWQWEKVGELEDSSDDEAGDPQQAEPKDESHSPQR